MLYRLSLQRQNWQHLWMRQTIRKVPKTDMRNGPSRGRTQFTAVNHVYELWMWFRFRMLLRYATLQSHIPSRVALPCAVFECSGLFGCAINWFSKLLPLLFVCYCVIGVSCPTEMSFAGARLFLYVSAYRTGVATTARVWMSLGRGPQHSAPW
jgi:hypothetical protein